MIQKDLVSIIIPTYNRAHLIGETLDSVIKQTYENWECIIVDDGSTDYTKKLLEFYREIDPRIKFFSRPPERPKGANACRNYGFEKSRGSYINWFDSDDLMHPEKLEIQVKFLKNISSNFSVCQTLVFKDGDKESLNLRHPRIFSDNALEDYISIQIVWLTPSSLWKRSFLESMEHLFDEELQAAQEWEFHCRCLFKSSYYHYINQPLVYVREHLQSISYGDEVRKYENYFKAREKVFEFLRSQNHSSNFLRKYFLSFYKQYLLGRDMKRAQSILRNQLLRDRKIEKRHMLKLIAAYFSYLVSGRGEILLKK